MLLFNDFIWRSWQSPQWCTSLSHTLSNSLCWISFPQFSKFFSFFNWVFLMLFMIFLLLSLKQKFHFDILNIAGSLREFLWSIQNVTVHNCSCVWLRGVWTGVDVWPLWPYIMQESANREPWHPEAITPIFQF